MSTIDTINFHVTNRLSDYIAIRRHIHQHPELSGKEHATVKFVKEKLSSFGVTHIDSVTPTGLVATIPSASPDRRTVMLRGDMDALPITEATGLPFSSKSNGVMHACGHDLHTTALLGVADYLQNNPDQWEGTAILIFQPSEEVIPSGAKAMIDTGYFDRIQPDVVIAQHVLPDMPTGHVGYRAGQYMASNDEIYLTVEGQGGHAALPHLYDNMLVIASHFLIAMQEITTHFIPKQETPSILAFGKIEGKGATNVIPDKVEVAGTFRVMDEGWRAKAKQRMHEIAAEMSENRGVKCSVLIKDGFPSIVNDIEKTEKAQQLSRQLWGNDKVEDMDIRMTSDDFAYFSNRYPAVYYRVGVKPYSGKAGGLHTPLFALNEDALPIAIQNMCYLTTHL